MTKEEFFFTVLTHFSSGKVVRRKKTINQGILFDLTPNSLS